jgi:hypothetical protein
LREQKKADNMAKHAYLMMAHDNFKVLKLALSIIDDSRNAIYLMVDRKSGVVDFAEFQKVVNKSRLTILPRIAINWAGFSMIEAMLLLIEAAVNSDEDYSYYHFMQGADLPIKSQDHIHDYFKDNCGKEFIDFAPRNYEFAKYKKFYYHLLVDNRFFRTNFAVKLANHTIARLQKMLGLKRVMEGNIYHGSALFSITDDFARYVLRNKGFIKHEYKYTLACDEVFMQTLIMHSKYKEKISAFEQPYLGNARYYDQSNSDRKNSPRILTMNDYEFLIALEKEICFARKFCEFKDLAIANKLHFHLKGYNL